MGEISLQPCLLGLDDARVEFFTPHGKVTAVMRRGERPEITAPKNVTVHCTQDVL